MYLEARSNLALLPRSNMERIRTATVSAVVTTFEFAMFLSIPATLMGSAVLFLLQYQQQVVTFLLR